MCDTLLLIVRLYLFCGNDYFSEWILNWLFRHFIGNFGLSYSTSTFLIIQFLKLLLYWQWLTHLNRVHQQVLKF